VRVRTYIRAKGNLDAARQRFAETRLVDARPARTAITRDGSTPGVVCSVVGPNCPRTPSQDTTARNATTPENIKRPLMMNLPPCPI